MEKCAAAVPSHVREVESCLSSFADKYSPASAEEDPSGQLDCDPTEPGDPFLVDIVPEQIFSPGVNAFLDFGRQKGVDLQTLELDLYLSSSSDKGEQQPISAERGANFGQSVPRCAVICGKRRRLR